jgi:excisionase family DNA binding protein
MTEEIRLMTELANSKSYLSMKDVQLLSGYSQTTIRRKIEEGKLKTLQQVPNGKLLFKKADVERWLENGAR